MKISLITSFYNGYDRFLSAWIDAVLSGFEKPDEIILVVSGNDFNPENIKNATEKLNGITHEVVYVPHRCMGQARNDGVRNAHNEWVMYLNVDDQVTKNAIRDIKKNLSDDIDILIGSMEWQGHPRMTGIKQYDITRESILRGGITNDHSSYRKSFWEKSPYIEYSGDIDMAFWLGLVQAGARIKCIKEVLTIHYFRPDSVFGKYSKEDLQEIRRMMAVWRVEGVHSERFNHSDYQANGDYAFKHKTELGDIVLQLEDEELAQTVSIIMTYRPDGGIRDKHREWIEHHYRMMFPKAEIIIVEDKSGDKGWDTFNKSALMNQGAKKAGGKILFFTDIDMVFIKNKLLRAFRQADTHSLVFPMDKIYFATEQQTKEILQLQGWAFPRIKPIECKIRKGRQANGSYVITKENYIKTGGHDERFIGWGSEDSVYIKVATTMIDQPYLRMEGDSIHLYHPHVPDRFIKRDSDKIKVMLNKRYRDALDNESAMRDIIKERGKV
jgi:glycosyltransferase involved in cell wall biosynthesis